MSEIVKDFWMGMPVGLYIILLLVIGLLITSFIIPPLGIISSSSLQGAALILGSAWLFYVTAHIPQFIESGAKIKASYGSAHIEIGKNRKEKEFHPIIEEKEEIDDTEEPVE